MKTLARTLWIALLLSGLPLAVTSAATPKEENSTPGAIYHNLYPPFVVNIAGESRLRFLKADITLRLASSADEARLRHHQPLLRHELIMLLSNQDEASLTDPEKKERVRQAALKKIQDVLIEKDGRQGVTDLLFMNFVMQR